jgi:c-di-GMP-binding flagellar brake protein YcgR
MNDEYQIPVQELLNVGKSFILPVGSPLQIELDGVTATLNSLSIGFLPDNYIIIRHPYKENFGPITNKLFKGNKITVRYLNGGNVFAFQSTIIGATNDPFKLVFMEYPTTIVRHSLRKDRRVQCYLPAELFNERKKDKDIISDMAYKGIISDISISGCSFDMIITPSIQAGPYVRINGPIALRIQMPGIENRIELFGRIKRMKRDSKKMNIGILFDEVDDGIIHSITEYIMTVEKSTLSDDRLWN